MSGRRYEQEAGTADTDRGILDVWLPFSGAGSLEAYGGRALVVVEGDPTDEIELFPTTHDLFC